MNVALQKLKQASIKVNQSDLAETLLWTILVEKVYLINKLRVLKNYSMNKAEMQKQKEQNLPKSRAGSRNVNFLGYRDNLIESMIEEEHFDKTQINVS